MNGRLGAMSIKENNVKLNKNLKLKWLYLTCVLFVFINVHHRVAALIALWLVSVFMYQLVFFCICFCFALLFKYLTFNCVWINVTLQEIVLEISAYFVKEDILI